jgi:hypothetical protein
LVLSGTFTTGGLGCQATIRTSGCTLRRRLWGTNNCAVGAKPVHFNG